MPVAIDERTSLTLSRIYDVPPEAVYAAWTDAEQMTRWMAPSDDFGHTTCSLDVRVGGRYRIAFRDPAGEVHSVGGTYREVVPNRRLVYTWAWESTPERESVVTIELRPLGARTELTLTHDRFADTEARDKHLHGWTGCLDRLGRFVSQ